MKPIFFTSDWHLGHTKSIEYDKRPFKDLDHMHQVLVNNFNASIPKDGITYFLGDVGFHNKNLTKNIIDELHGVKVLILGNHDGRMSGMYTCGFDAVLYNATLVIANEIVTLSHFPLYGVWREDITGMRGVIEGEHWHGESRARYKPYLIYDNGQYHLHGHIHSGPHNGKKKIDGRQYDVGVSANNYRPVSISQIESWIALSKK